MEPSLPRACEICLSIGRAAARVASRGAPEGLHAWLVEHLVVDHGLEPATAEQAAERITAMCAGLAPPFCAQ